jgi:membrane fusion protein (multidrug efflux system)
VSRNPKGQAVALVVDDKGMASQRVLAIERAIGNLWLVMSGLSQGDRLIVEGLLKVRPGAPVKAVLVNLDQPGAGVSPVPSK